MIIIIKNINYAVWLIYILIYVNFKKGNDLFLFEF